MNISDLKLEGLMDDVNTVGGFLAKYAGIYPPINEVEFQKQLDTLDAEFQKQRGRGKYIGNFKDL